VGPRQAVEPSSSQVPRYPVAPEGPVGVSSSGNPEFRTDVLSVLYVKVGTGADLRADRTPNTAPADLQSLIGNAMSGHGGSKLGTDRDGFAALFSSPSSSIATALALRKEMASTASSGGDTIVARIGVHTGESKQATGGLSALDLSKAEEIAAVCHPGQIVVSEATATLLADSLPEGAHLEDLGLHRLRDLGHPERLFEVEEEGVRSDFPPLRSLDNPVLLHNLPERLSSFIGRDREQAELRGLVSSSRLVTLIGPGGVGKTRLALQVAAELLDGEGDGVWLVELAGVSDPEKVTTSVASALSVQPDPARTLRDSLVECLKHQRMLLVLDNCEHVIDSVATLVDSFLTSCPGVHVLATSREPLAIDGEAVYRINPLLLPPPGAEDPHDFDAIRLFEERARSNQPAFEMDDSNRDLVVSLCSRLDGIPLALELAAARLRSTSLLQIHNHLDDRFRLLTGGSRSALPRQQTLLATVEWSYELLDRDEQQLLKQLSSFSGDFLLETAEALCSRSGSDVLGLIDQLGSLVDKSLVVFDPAPSWPRYRLLETIRQFAWGKVRSEDDDDAQRTLSDTHAETYLELVETAGTHLRAPEQLEWFDRLDIEHDNIRAAIGHLLSDPSDIAKASRIAVSLKWFWQIRGHRVEALDTLEQLSQRIESGEPTLMAAKVLSARGEFLVGVDAQRAETCFERALAMARDVGEDRLAAIALSSLASIANQRGDADTESRVQREAIELARAIGDPIILGDVLSGPSADPDILEQLQEAIDCFDTAGDLTGRYIALLDLGAMSLARVGPGVARLHLEAAMDLGRVIGVGKDHTLIINVAEACILEGDFARAKELYTDAVRVARRHADERAVPYGILGLALCASAQGAYDLAVRLHGLADARLSTLGYVWAPENLALAEADRRHLTEVVGEEAFATAFGVGGSLGIDEAMALFTGSAADGIGV
jgi:predicted ATPase